MTTVFDCTARTDTSHKKRSEGIFTYWNRSARPGSDISRGLIEDWFSHVPAAEQHNFRSRFRRGSDAELGSAFQELCLHELLLRQQCTPSFHPAVNGTGNRPDYRVFEPDGAEFILEATSSIVRTTGPKINPRRNRIWDRLQDLKLDGFSIGINDLTEGSMDLRWQSLERHVTEEIKKTPIDDSGCISIPAFETADGWRVKLIAIPAFDSGHTTGSVRYEAWSGSGVSPSSMLLDALKDKGGRYGRPPMPFVISLNSLDSMLTDRSFDETLFGSSPARTIPAINDGIATAGFWGTAQTQVYRRVSAVLFTTNLCPETLLMGQVQACLYLNPWANWPYKGVLTKLDVVRNEDGKLQRYPGAPIHQLLHLRLHDSSLWK